MEDWKAYIVTKLKSDVWGGVALDYYSKCKADKSKSLSSEEFIDWIIKEISPECEDLGEFHRIFLGIMVRILGADFGKAMGYSIELLKTHKEKSNTATYKAFVEHYSVYNIAGNFKELLMKNLDITSLEKEASDEKHCIRICHISDLHFGFYHDSIKYTGVDHEFEKTDHFINFLRDEDITGQKIDLLIISGDITSIAADEEYTEFVKFIEEVKETKVIPEDDYYRRIVLVPGNHEARRGEDYKRADYLNNFNEFIKKLRDEGIHLSTPYSTKGDGLCVINNTSKEKIPYAMYEYPSLQIQVLTLVSSHYAQAIDQEIHDLMSEYEGLKKEFYLTTDKKRIFDQLSKYFEKRIWLDTGVFSPDYFGKIKTDLHTYLRERKESKFLKIAVAHHNPTNYFGIDGIEHTQNALELLKILGGFGFSYYLHGHIHYNPQPEPIHNVMQLSAPTLGGKPLKGFAGFNILEWKPNDDLKCKVNRYELRDNKYIKIAE